MWIVCAGAKRSGSTLQYNILSKIVEVSESGKRLPYFKPDEFDKVVDEHKDFDGFKVVKLHILTQEVKNQSDKSNAIIIHSYRDIRDVVVSYINKGWIQKNIPDIVTSVQLYLKDYDNWTQLDKNFFSRKYEEFAFKIEEEIKYYAKILGIVITDHQIDTISKELSIEQLKKIQENIEKGKEQEFFNNTFHQDTLLHINHINDGSANQFLDKLSNDQIAVIEAEAHEYLIKNNYKVFWPKNDYFISHSQHADDYIAWQLLGKKRSGVVVEVGAFDGKHLSNSYSLSQLGWKSVCIEPSPEIFKFLQQNRPDALNVNKAVVGDESVTEITFYSEEIGVLSGCNYDEEDVKLRYRKRGLDYQPPKEMKVGAITLGKLLDELSLEQVDILSIDVEGFEMEVLKGLNLSNLKVSVFIIEANTPVEVQQIKRFFAPHSAYLFIGNNIQNLFFIHKKTVKKKDLKNLGFKDFFAAKQVHPKGKEFVIDSIPPEFQKSRQALKYEKFMGII